MLHCWPRGKNEEQWNRIVVVPAQRLNKERPGTPPSHVLGRQAARSLKYGLNCYHHHPSTTVYTTITFTTPLPFFHIEAMPELKKKMEALGETMDAAQRREYERVVDDVKIFKHEMEVVISYQFAMVVQDAEDEIAKSKDSRQRETLLRELRAELEDTKPGMLQVFGEDSGTFCSYFVRP